MKDSRNEGFKNWKMKKKNKINDQRIKESEKLKEWLFSDNFFVFK